MLVLRICLSYTQLVSRESFDLTILSDFVFQIKDTNKMIILLQSTNFTTSPRINRQRHIRTSAIIQMTDPKKAVVLLPLNQTIRIKNQRANIEVNRVVIAQIEDTEPRDGLGRSLPLENETLLLRGENRAVRGRNLLDALDRDRTRDRDDHDLLHIVDREGRLRETD